MNNPYPLYLPLYGLGCILPILIGIGLVLWIVSLTRQMNRLRFLAISAVAIFISLCLAIWTFFSVGGDFGPGAGMFFSSIFAALVALSLAFIKRQNIEPINRWIYTILACVIIPSSLLAIPIMSMIPNDTCNRLDRETGMTLVSAIDSYKADYGTYPRKLDVLTPKYIAAIPEGPCHPPANVVTSFIFSVTANYQDYYLCQLYPNRILIGITVTSGGFYQAYDLEKKEWLFLDNIDQGCQSLRE